MPPGPKVSIVTATYNRSNVLRYALGAVRASSFADWEHLVVGDACTDDTAEVVAACEDSRIRFVNLAENVGEQSGPNNEGLRLARSRYVALLNHDDLWLPDHLEKTLTALEDTGADLVFTLSLIIDQDERVHLGGVTPSGRYVSSVFVPASSWVFRRALVDEVGGWRPGASLHAPPSADWIQRVHRAGKVILGLPVVTLVVINSGGRKNAYAERQFEEYAYAAERLRSDPQYLVSLLTSTALDLARGQRRVRPLLARAARNLGVRILESAGVHPIATKNRVRYWRHGGFIDHLRRTRGLGPLPRRVM